MIKASVNYIIAKIFTCGIKVINIKEYNVHTCCVCNSHKELILWIGSFNIFINI